MIDFLYKISRKLLPSFLYRVFQRSALGRVKSWEKFSTYQNIFRFYESSIKESLTDKVIAETGCGNQIYTACLFLMNGARNVVLVEPKLDLINDNRAIKNAILIFRKHYPQFLLSETDVKSKISVFSGLEKVPEEMNGKIDMFFSHLVLEHIYPIEFFYSNVARLLSTDGFALNRVDLTDHTYHILKSLNRYWSRRRTLRSMPSKTHLHSFLQNVL